MSNTVILLTNILTPYRIFFYDALYEAFHIKNIDFRVLVCARTEKGRSWYYEDFERPYTTLLQYKSININNRIFLHFNKGLDKIYKQLHPNIIICGGTYLSPSVWKTILLNKKMGAQLYYWSESHLNEKRNYNKIILFIRDILRKMIYTSMDGFWYAGKLSKEFILKYCGKNKTLIFVPNLVDNSFFEKIKLIDEGKRKQIKSKYLIENNKVVFILPARLTAVKGIIEFLELIGKTPSKDKIQILIAGEGELKNNIIEKIKMLNLEKTVKLIGYVNQNEIIDIYAISDFLLLPSLSDSNPLVVIEACWCRLPLLLSEHCGNHYEIVHDNENGYVFSYSNENEAVSIIEKCVNSCKEWRIEAGEKSYSIVNDIYNPSKVVARITNEIGVCYEKWKGKQKN